MANVKFSRKEVEKHIKLNSENLDKIMMLGIPVEGLTDKEIEIQVLPNRPDLLSMQGFLRAINSALGKEPGLKKYKVNAAEKNFKVKIDSSVKGVRPYTACAIVKDLHFDEEKIKEIVEMQEKLHVTLGRNRKKAAIGIYPLEKIALPIRFEARKPEDIRFIPLEAEKEMNGLQILQRHPKGKDFAHLLEDQEKYPIFVDANNKILSMPPIINSHETGKITEKTTTVFVECSGFDFANLKKILNIIVTSLADMGGKIYAMELDYGKKEITPDLTPDVMRINLNNVNKTMGLALKEKDLQKILPKMGFEYKSGKVSIPAWRTDILHEVDIIEDIGIAYGYDNLEPEIPKVATIGQEAKHNLFHSKVADILAGLGLLEVSSLHLIKQDEAKEIVEKERIEVADSKTDYKFLRPNLMVPAMRILSENKDNEYPQKFFEIGTVFESDKSSDTGIKERQVLFVTLAPGNFTEAKQDLDYLLRMIGLEAKISESKHDSFIDGRTGKIIVDGKEVGYIGEVHPKVLSNWNLLVPVAAFELELDKVLELI